MRDPDDARLRLYVLGLMPEAEAEALEEAYLARPDLLSRVREAEDDLLDDCVAGTLAASERDALESRARSSPRLAQRMVAARALRLAGTSAPATAPARARRTMLAFAAGLAAAVVAVWIWRLPEPKRMAVQSPPPSPSPRATEAATPSARPSAPAVARLALALSPTLLRGGAGPTEVRLPPAPSSLVFELRGDQRRVRPGPRLTATIETVEGERVLTGVAIPATPSASDVVATLELPAAHLPAGDYILTLAAGDRVLHRYFFRVLGR